MHITKLIISLLLFFRSITFTPEIAELDRRIGELELDNHVLSQKRKVFEGGGEEVSSIYL